MSRDADGELMARPRNWDQEANGLPPAIAVKLRKDERRPPGIGDEALAKIFPAKGDDGVSYTARIIKVFDKNEGRVLGVVRQLKDGSYRLEPVERTQDELVLPEGALSGAKPGDLVEVSPNRGNRHGLASGSVEQVIGQLGTERAISAIAIHAHGIPHVFPPEVLDEAEKAEPVSAKDREDWREMPLITIDPADAKDHDDAVFAEPDDDESNPGGQIVTVAIADVAAYVRPDTAMDREALKRGNSVYFPDRVVPMLPERISNDLCSLRENEDRPAMAVRMVFDSGGRKVRHSFHRILMRSSARLSYQQVQAAIDGAPDDKTEPLLETVLKPLWAAYRVLSQARSSRGPLDLDIPERKIRLKKDGTIDRIEVPPRLEAHRLIEEFMIQANVSAAETLERKKHPLIYRVHDEPSLAKQEVLREFLKSIGQSLQRGPALDSTAFNGILERTRGGPYEAMTSEIVLRTQSQAVYSPYNLGHFGLSLSRYAHFTSPIRRYADLIVHRALISALKLGRRWPFRRKGTAAGRYCRVDFRCGAAGDAGRTRDRRPADCRLPCRTDRRTVRRSRHRRDEKRSFRRTRPVRRRRLRPDLVSRPGIFPFRRGDILGDRRQHRSRLADRRCRRSEATGSAAPRRLHPPRNAE